MGSERDIGDNDRQLLEEDGTTLSGPPRPPHIAMLS